MPICEAFGSCAPTVSWSLPTGECLCPRAVFSNAFTLLLKLWSREIFDKRGEVINLLKEELDQVKVAPSKNPAMTAAANKKKPDSDDENSEESSSGDEEPQKNMIKPEEKAASKPNSKAEEEESSDSEESSDEALSKPQSVKKKASSSDEKSEVDNKDSSQEDDQPAKTTKKSRGRSAGAEAEFGKLLGGLHVKSSMVELSKSNRGDEVDSLKLSELLYGRHFRVVFIGSALLALQQLSGINAVFYFSSTVFKSAGVPSDIANMFVGVVNLSVVAMVLMDKLGRKGLLLGSFMGMALSMTMQAVAGSTLVSEPSVVYLSVGGVPL